MKVDYLPLNVIYNYEYHETTNQRGGEEKCWNGF